MMSYNHLCGYYEMMLVNVEMKLDFTVFMKGIISNLILEVMIV